MCRNSFGRSGVLLNLPSSSGILPLRVDVDIQRWYGDQQSRRDVVVEGKTGRSRKEAGGDPLPRQGMRFWIYPRSHVAVLLPRAKALPVLGLLEASDGIGQRTSCPFFAP